MVTLFTVTTVGAVFYLHTSVQLLTDPEAPLLTGRVLRAVWNDPALLGLGLRLAIPTVLILLSHELGHYVACRFYRYPVTPPYFLPVPFGLGTLGAFIRIGAPVRNRRELFDIGAAGPLAGFAALLPFLILGIQASTVVPQPEPLEGIFWQRLTPGSSLGLRLVTWLVHGPVPEGHLLELHPYALAAWVGLLATALNLLPLGQLDGGHILYSLFGSQRYLARALWLGLLALGVFWLGWVVWCVVILVLGLRHPPVAEEVTPLGRTRTGVAVGLLLIFLFSFAPAPLSLAYFGL